MDEGPITWKTQLISAIGTIVFLALTILVGYQIYQQVVIRTSWNVVDEHVTHMYSRRMRTMRAEYTYVVDGLIYTGRGRVEYPTSSLVFVRVNPINPSESVVQWSVFKSFQNILLFFLFLFLVIAPWVPWWRFKKPNA